MRVGVLIFVLVAVCSPVASAQEAGPAGDGGPAVELIELLRLREMTEASFEMTMESMLAQNPTLEQFRDIFVDFFNQYARWEDLHPEYVRIYSEAYTEAELRELIAFYRTPVGQKTIDLMPQLMQKGAEVSQQMIQPHLPELERRIQERLNSGAHP